MSPLPFVRLNLHRNPFGEPTPEERPGLFAGGLEAWPSFLCPGPIPGVEKGALKKLMNLHGPDLKAVQADLYNRYQQLEDGA
jgi:hypothetical protein